MTITQRTVIEPAVLIVGAGPTGLTLAAHLLARGIRPVVIDKGNGPAEQSRALGMNARTLEMLDTIGLADASIAQGHPVHHLRMYAGPRTLFDVDLRRNGSRFDFQLHIPQCRTEAILRAHVQELGGTIEHGVELVRLAQDAEAVTATLRSDSGREWELRAAYVVGCDGAHSRVRHELGLAFEGRPYAQEWVLGDVALSGAGSEDCVHLYFGRGCTPLTCVPLGGGRWRVTIANAGERDLRAPSLDEIQQLLDARAPHPITASDPHWLACFRCHLRSVSDYRRGHVLIAGDAAHVHSPAGGQGMNTGMMDAYVLAAKLARVVGGQAPEEWLDTYTQERLPAAAGVLRFTDSIVGLMTMRSPTKRAVRNAVLPVATRLPMVQRRWARRLSQTALPFPSVPSTYAGLRSVVTCSTTKGLW